MKKFLMIGLALLMALSCLCGCADDNAAVDSPSAGEYGAYEDFFPKLTYEVKNQDGKITEQMYGLYRDEEFKTVVGMKDVYFSEETGKMNQYIVTLGLIVLEKTVTFREDNNGNTFLTEMLYNSDGIVTKGNSENNYVNADGVKIREVAQQEYHTDGISVKKLKVEVYRDGELASTTVQTFDEDGNLTSEEAK